MLFAPERILILKLNRGLRDEWHHQENIEVLEQTVAHGEVVVFLVILP